MSSCAAPLPKHVGSINSEGLPNAGIDYYLSKTVLEGVAGTDKPYIVSLSGLKVADNIEMLARVAAASVSFPGKVSISLSVYLSVEHIPYIAPDIGATVPTATSAARLL